MSNKGGSLFLEITSSADKAKTGIDSLKNSLEKLQDVANSFKLGNISGELSKVSNALIKFSKSVTQETIDNIAKVLQPLDNLSDKAIGETVKQLDKLPKVFEKIAEFDLRDFNANIKELTTAMQPLAVEMDKVAKGFDKLPTSMRKTREESVRTKRSLKDMISSITPVHLSIYALIRLSSKAIVESNKFVENLNLFFVSMGDNYQEALDYAYKVQDAFAIDPSEWIRFQGTFQNMLTGFGLTSDAASSMSKTLTQLGYDLSTLFNVDYEIAMQKLRSGISGQPRPMREWGFDMSESTIKLTAMKMGIDANVESMTQFEKSQLRFVQIMNTARQQGVLNNFARELITPANALRILKQQVVQLVRALGNLFIPILMRVLPYVQAFVMVLTDALKAIGRLIGFKLPEIDYSGLQTGSGLLEDIDKGFEDVADKADGASAAVKRFQNVLAGFDEINLLRQPDLTSGMGGVGAILDAFAALDPTDLGIDFSEYEYDFIGNAKLKAQEIVDAFKKKFGPFFKWLEENFEILKIAALGVGATMLAWKFWDLFKGGARVPIGIILTITGIALATSGLSNIFAGDGDLKDAILAVVGTALGIAGPLIAFGTGALGITLAVAAVLTILIASVFVAGQKRAKATVEKALYDNIGVPISKLGQEFTINLNKITSGLQPIIVKMQDLSIQSDQLDKDAVSIENWFAAFAAGIEPTIEILDDLYEAMTQFVIDKKFLLQEASLTLAGVFSKEFGVFNEDATDYIEGLTEVTKAEMERLDESQKILDRSKEQYASGEISADQHRKNMEEVWASYNVDTQSAADAIEEYSARSQAALEGIDWESSATKTQVLEEMVADIKRTGGEIDEYIAGLELAGNLVLKTIPDEGEREAARVELQKFIKQIRDGYYESLTSETEDLMSVIQQDLAGKLMDTVFAALGEGASKSDLRHIRNEFKAEIIEPLYEIFSEQFELLGIDSAEDLMNSYDYIFDEGLGGFLDGAFHDKEYNTRDMIQRFAGAFNEEFGEFETETGEIANLASRKIMSLLKSGFEEFGPEAQDALMTILKGMQDGTIDENKYLSTIMAKLPPELANALKQEDYTLLTAWLTMMGTLEGGMSQAMINLQNIISNTTLPSLTLNVHEQIHYATYNPISHRIEAKAAGGFVDEGQAFVAREAGPELVGTIGRKTAVVNNDQIVESVSRGVANAVSSVIGTKSSSGGHSGDIIIKVGESEFGRIAANSINLAGRQAGRALVEV